MKLLLSVLAVLALSGPAFAQAPRSISYQGVLTDNTGVPIADGAYSLTVRLYDVAVGGAAVYTEVHAAVSVAQGGFNVLIGSVTPLTLVFDQPYWLSLQVGADPELAPRVALAASPYSLGLSLPFDGRADDPSVPTITLHNASGPALLTEGNVKVNSSTGVPAATISSFGALGGQVAARDELGSAVVRVEPDATGTGGFFSVYRSSSSIGFAVNGNDGTEEPVVNVIGSARSATFDMSVSGDASVTVPSSAINSAEQFNEPGVAEVFSNSSIAVGNGVTTIVSRTITVPDDGYVIAIGMGHCEMGHVNGTDSRIIYGVNDVNGVFASSAAVAGLPSSAPSGNSYRFPTPFTGVWPATPGAHTFYLLAQKIGAANGIVLSDPTITLLYVPTAYGTVSGNVAFPDGAQESPSGPATPADIEAERSEAVAFDQARIQRELDQVRAQLDAIQSRISNDPSVPAAAPQQ